MRKTPKTPKPTRKHAPAPAPAIVAKIAEELLPLAVPIASLRLDERNARKHGQLNLDAIAASLKRFGQRAPLVVVGDVVKAGNGRLLAAQQLGWTHVAVLSVDDDDKEALAYALADNRTAELASWDLEALSTILQEIGPDNAIGWRSDELEALLSADWEPPAVDPDYDGAAGRAAAGGREAEAVSLRFTGPAAAQIKAIAAARGWRLDAWDEWPAAIIAALTVPS
jgi:hypothetical protein